jgi:virginiamycin B lyase
VTEFPVPTANSGPSEVVLGPDGNVWFTEFNSGRVAQITPQGAIQEFPTPSLNSTPYFIAVGSDGNIWFTEFETGKVGRIVP